MVVRTAPGLTCIERALCLRLAGNPALVLSAALTLSCALTEAPCGNPAFSALTA